MFASVIKVKPSWNRCLEVSLSCPITKLDPQCLVSAFVFSTISKRGIQRIWPEHIMPSSWWPSYNQKRAIVWSGSFLDAPQPHQPDTDNSTLVDVIFSKAVRLGCLGQMRGMKKSIPRSTVPMHTHLILVNVENKMTMHQTQYGCGM